MEPSRRELPENASFSLRHPLGSSRALETGPQGVISYATHGTSDSRLLDLDFGCALEPNHQGNSSIVSPPTPILPTRVASSSSKLCAVPLTCVSNRETSCRVGFRHPRTHASTQISKYASKRAREQEMNRARKHERRSQRENERL